MELLGLEALQSDLSRTLLCNHYAQLSRAVLLLCRIFARRGAALPHTFLQTTLPDRSRVQTVLVDTVPPPCNQS